MKRVAKSATEPLVLTEFKERFAKAPTPPTYSQFKTNRDRREDLKLALRNDQRGLCAYCEINLIPVDESVEHFIPRQQDNSLELAWTNLLLCCSGGEHPLPEDIPDAQIRFDPNSPKTCGHAKLGATEAILNPIDLLALPPIWRIKSETGELLPDENGCQETGVDSAVANVTILILKINAGRLNRARLVVFNEMLKLLSETGENPALTLERALELAREEFPAQGTLPAFFTTIRLALAEGAEQHLRNMNFLG